MVDEVLTSVSSTGPKSFTDIGLVARMLLKTYLSLKLK